jgi:hypothetical protein
MSLSRRKTLALLGGGLIVAAGGSVAGFAATRTPARALAPWEAVSGYVEPRRRALSYAILAPNAHNLQPWLIELEGEDGVVIHRDPARALPQTDPFDRQIIISFGCFLEQLAIAASADGHALDIALFPEGEGAGRPVAAVRFQGGAAADPLFEHVLARRSTKEPFDLARPVAAGDLARLVEAGTAGGAAPVRAEATAEAGAVEALRALTWEAWAIEAATPAAHHESVELMRFGRREIEASPDGIDLGGPMLEALMLAGLLTREAQRDPESRGFQAGVDIYRAMLEATPAYLWLATPGNTREEQVAAGRAWLRVNLAATAAGLGLHPVSQALQEYVEMAGPHAAARAMLGRDGETVQMLGRVGYGPATPPSPRWPLERKLVG